MKPDAPRSCLRLLVASLLVFAGTSAMAAELQVADLMHKLAQTKSGRATFIEKKYIGIVDKPLESSGELAFTAPDKLEKRTLKPKPESLVLDGNSLTIDQPGKRRVTVSLQDYPEVSAFVESIRGTLAGDLGALEKVYKLELSGSAEKWSLVLTPMQARMSNIISRIRIGGSQADVKTIDFDQADGDRSEMLVTKVSAQ